MTEAKNTIEIKRTVKEEAELKDMLSECHRNNSNGLRNSSDDFNRLEIRDVVIEGKNLRGSEFQFSKLINVTFLSCRMNSADFKYAEFENVLFKGCQAEDMKFQFDSLKNVKFEESNICGCEFDFAHGNIEFMNCHMENCEFPGAEMHLKMTHCNGECSEFNGGKFIFEASGSRLARAEFNESELSGTIAESVCTNAEINSSICNAFELKDCKVCRIEHEDSIGFRINNEGEDLDSILNDDEEENEETDSDFLNELIDDSSDSKDIPY